VCTNALAGRASVFISFENVGPHEKNVIWPDPLFTFQSTALKTSLNFNDNDGQVRVVGGRGGQRVAAKTRSASDESGAEAATTARQVRTVVYDDDVDDWNKPKPASKRRNYVFSSAAPPLMTQVS